MDKTTRTPEDGLNTGDDAVYQRQGAVTVFINGKKVSSIVKGDKGDAIIIERKTEGLGFPDVDNKIVIAVKIGSLVKHIYLTGKIYEMKVSRWS